MSYQFAHVELHSRKGGKAGSVGYILDEAERLEGACPHVPNPAPPVLVFGMPLSQLRADHEACAGAARVTLENGRTRKVRQDQNTLVSLVMSFPGELASADPVAVREWEERSVAWLQKELGAALKSVVRHVDETHPHLHAYGWNDAGGMSATALHPGFAAKAATVAAGGDNRAGDRAYRAAMRQWQDRYWQDVGLPSGLARLGPGRRRLTREQWHAEKTVYQAVREARGATKVLVGQGKAFLEHTRATAAATAAAAKVEADTAKADARRLWFEAKKDRAAAEREKFRAESLGGRLGSLIAAVKSIITGRDRRIEERVRIEAAATLAAARAETGAVASALLEERQKTKELKTSLREARSESKTLRLENERLQNRQIESRPSGRPFRPV